MCNPFEAARTASEREMAKTKYQARLRRKTRIRSKIKGTVERPRMVVFRSSRHIFAQVIDDENNKVIAAAGTMGKANSAELEGQKKSEKAAKVGKKVAEICKSKGVEKVVFDRCGFRYHGRVKALASAAREAGLKF